MSSIVHYSPTGVKYIIPQNSALVWFPKIEAAGLPVPKTVMVPYSHHGILSIFDGEHSAEFDRLVDAVKDACDVVGYPAFIRTDLTSAKHSGPKAYVIKDAWKRNVCRPLARTLEDSELKLFMERHGPEAIMVREFLTLPAPFTAFHGLPISREWRLFADGETVHCSHPYWPPGAIEATEEYDKSLPADWRDKLAVLNRQPAEHESLYWLAVRAAQACGGDRWSVDFAQDHTGKWYLIDMARAEDSWHWPGCPVAVKR